LMAAGALQAIQDQGLRVPEDVGVVGFDDLALASVTQPPLTTVRQPIDLLGGHSTRILIGLLEGEITPPYQQELPTQLIIRKSCGMPENLPNLPSQSRTNRMAHWPI